MRGGIGRSDLAYVTAWIFDLDNTLYRADADFFGQIDRKMTDYIARYLALEPVEARQLQKRYLAEYGTSLSGLMAVDGMDPAPFLDFVHDVELHMLDPDPALRARIDALPGRKFIFTNGSRAHARNVGEHLGLYDLFDGVFAIEDVDYVPKPRPEPYRDFCAHFGVDPARAVMFEDSARNLEVPKRLGMATVLVASDTNWSEEPELTRPAGAHTAFPAWIDAVTDDLAGWLEG